jgi:hypothetical protein
MEEFKCPMWNVPGHRCDMVFQREKECLIHIQLVHYDESTMSYEEAARVRMLQGNKARFKCMDCCRVYQQQSSVRHKSACKGLTAEQKGNPSVKCLFVKVTVDTYDDFPRREHPEAVEGGEGGAVNALLAGMAAVAAAPGPAAPALAAVAAAPVEAAPDAGFLRTVQMTTASIKQVMKGKGTSEVIPRFALREVWPAKSLGAARRAFVQTLKGFKVGDTGSCVLAAQKLSIFFAVLLRKRQGGKDPSYRKVVQRARLFEQGKLEATIGWNEWSQQQVRADEERQVRAINAALDKGEVGRASRLMEDLSIKHPSDKAPVLDGEVDAGLLVRDKLKLKFPQELKRPLPELDADACDAIQVSVDEVERAVKDAPFGRAAGVSGDRNELWKPLLLNEPEALGELTRVINMVLDDQMPRGALKELRTSRLLALGDKCRPVQICTPFIYLVDRLAVSASQPEWSGVFEKYQMAVGKSSGTHKIGLAGAVLSEIVPGVKRVRSDAANAYGEVRRESIARAVWKYVRCLYRYTAATLGVNHRMVCSDGSSIECHEGVQQGSASATLLYCLPLQLVLEEVAEEHPDTILMGYADDVELCGEAADGVGDVFEAYGCYKEKAREMMGVELSDPKMQVLCTDAEGVPAQWRHLVTSSAVVMGRPTGDEQYILAEARKIVEDVKAKAPLLAELRNAQGALHILVHSLGAKFDHLIQTVTPGEGILQAAGEFDEACEDAMALIIGGLGVTPEQRRLARYQLHLPTAMGGVGLRSMKRLAGVAVVGTFARCIEELLQILSKDWVREAAGGELRELLATLSWAPEAPFCKGMLAAYVRTGEQVAAALEHAGQNFNIYPRVGDESEDESEDEADDTASLGPEVPNRSFKLPEELRVTCEALGQLGDLSWELWTETLPAAAAEAVGRANVQKWLSDIVHMDMRVRLFSQLRVTGKARLLAAGEDGAGLFLRASRKWASNRLTNDAMVHALRSRLGLRVVTRCFRGEAVRCDCGKLVRDVPDSHANTCEQIKGGAKKAKHDRLRDAMIRMFAMAGIAVQKEPLIDPGPGGGDRRGDLEVDTGGGMSILADLTVGDPTGKTHMKRGTTRQVGRMIADMKAVKNNKYAGLMQANREFLPLVWSVFGGFSEGVTRLVNLAARAAQAAGWTSAGRFRVRWKTELSVLLQRLNWQCTLGYVESACKVSGVRFGLSRGARGYMEVGADIQVDGQNRERGGR